MTSTIISSLSLLWILKVITTTSSGYLCLVAVVKMHSISLFEELNGCFVLILLEVDAIIGVYFQTGIT